MYHKSKIETSSLSIILVKCTSAMNEANLLNLKNIFNNNILLFI